MGIVSNRAAARSLVGADPAEQRDDWAQGRRCLPSVLDVDAEAAPTIHLLHVAAALERQAGA